MNPIDKALKPIWIQACNQEPTLELHSLAARSVEAHHRANGNGPGTGSNSGGMRIIKKVSKIIWARVPWHRESKKRPLYTLRYDPINSNAKIWINFNYFSFISYCLNISTTFVQSNTTKYNEGTYSGHTKQYNGKSHSQLIFNQSHLWDVQLVLEIFLYHFFF